MRRSPAGCAPACPAAVPGSPPQLLSDTPTFNPVVGASAQVQLPQLALATLISVAPVLVIFLVAQRFLVSGLTAGATKD